MKKYIITAIILGAAFLAACEEEQAVTYGGECDVLATVEDNRGLDGCGFLFKLDNGEYLEPQILMFCGTPPLPPEYYQDPLNQFELKDGQRVSIGFDYLDGYASVCMRGKMVKITCIQEIGSPTESY